MVGTGGRRARPTYDQVARRGGRLDGPGGLFESGPGLRDASGAPSRPLWAARRSAARIHCATGTPAAFAAARIAASSSGRTRHDSIRLNASPFGNGFRPLGAPLIGRASSRTPGSAVDPRNTVCQYFCVRGIRQQGSRAGIESSSDPEAYAK